ncbi:hypothetical protein [Vandammella animalimorsus]|uniref:hypothetical protein n=1 Tax=Vandammella animalimorsus TaxID=2029117 RepID=UPI001557AB5D|nr:hypothetical protein [Vandammella animalimorsus]
MPGGLAGSKRKWQRNNPQQRNQIFGNAINPKNRYFENNHRGKLQSIPLSNLIYQSTPINKDILLQSNDTPIPPSKHLKQMLLLMRIVSEEIF